MKEETKLLLQRQYSFMQKQGIITEGFDKSTIINKYGNQKLLVVMCGVEGSGKTTFCKNNFAEYRVRNLDDILAEYLSKHTRRKFTSKDIENINLMFFNSLKRDLKQHKIAIADAGANDFLFRVVLLDVLKNDYDKVVLIVLNTPIDQIKRNVMSQIELRARPGLLKDIEMQFEMLQVQINSKDLFMGVDEAYML